MNSLPRFTWLVDTGNPHGVTELFIDRAKSVATGLNTLLEILDRCELGDSIEGPGPALSSFQRANLLRLAIITTELFDRDAEWMIESINDSAANPGNLNRTGGDHGQI